jgi:hypothetical protein
MTTLPYGYQFRGGSHNPNKQQGLSIASYRVKSGSSIILLGQPSRTASLNGDSTAPPAPANWKQQRLRLPTGNSNNDADKSSAPLSVVASLQCDGSGRLPKSVLAVPYNYHSWKRM